MRAIQKTSLFGSGRRERHSSHLVIWPASRLVAPLRAAIIAVLCLSPALGLRVAHAAVSLPWNISVTSGPSALARPAVAVGQDGNIYVFGGTLGNDTDYNTTFIYQPGTNSWSMGAPMPVAREGARAVTLPDGRIAVLGGGTQCEYNNLCSNGTVYNRVDVYTPATNSWASLAPMQSPRYRFAAVFYQGEIFAMGGSDGTQAVASAEAYDPSSDSWSAVASLPQPLEAPAAAVDSTNEIDLFGGFDGVSTVYNTMYTYSAGQWSSGAALPEATEDGDAAVGADGQVYLVGGFNFDQMWLTTVQVYNPSQASWSYGTALPAPTCCSGTVIVPGGQLYVVDGGVSAGSQVAIYGPSIALSPPAGPADSTAAMTGTYFAPGATVNLYWGASATGTPLATGSTDGNGNLTAPISFTVPPSATPGVYTLTAVDDQSQYPVTTTFVVPAPGPNLPALSTRSGGYRQPVRVTGANFQPGEPVVLYWDRLSAPLTATVSTTGGTFNTGFAVPATAAGQHYILALGLRSHHWAYAGFVVRPRTVLAHPAATPGQPNTLVALGFSAGETVSVYWQSTGAGGNLLGTAVANAQGSATVAFTTPAGAPGIYNVLSTGQDKGGIATLTLGT